MILAGKSVLPILEKSTYYTIKNTVKELDNIYDSG